MRDNGRPANTERPLGLTPPRRCISVLNESRIRLADTVVGKFHKEGGPWTLNHFIFGLYYSFFAVQRLLLQA